MRKIILALAAFLALSSCDSSPRGKDGYFFETKTERLTPQRRIEVVTYPSIDAVKLAYAEKVKKPLPSGRELQAFAVITRDVCTIHAVDPKITYAPEWLGHEMTHCLYGEYHPSQNG